MEMLPLAAAIRFGLGPRPDQPLPVDALAWLDSQLDGPDTPPPPPPGQDRYRTVADGFQIWRDLDAMGQPAPGQKNPIEENFVAEATTQLAWRIDTPQPYRERLADFWANHFTVSKRAGYPVSTTIGPYLREAIRPHVTGRFTDMLLAVFRHPAMLYYLDQTASVGPSSPYGKRSGRGLNENLAREIMELHTVSPASGYTQADVTEFARLLTGWGVERNKDPFGTLFRPSNHEPGPKTVMGERFEEGPDSAEQALRFLACPPPPPPPLARKPAPPPAAMSPSSSPAISWPTTRRPRWWPASPAAGATRMAISAPSPACCRACRKPGRSPSASSARRRTSSLPPSAPAAPGGRTSPASPMARATP